MENSLDFTNILNNYMSKNSPFGDFRASSTKMHVEKTINLLYSHLNIVITNLEISVLGFYTGKAVCGDFITDINIYLYNPNSISIDFENLIVLKDKMVSSTFDNPIIQSIVNDLNQSLPLLDSLRLSNDSVEYFPVFPYINPSFSISCTTDTNKMRFNIDFKVLVKSGLVELLEPYLLYANNQSIQDCGQSRYRDISNIYSITGETIKNDFEKYRLLMLEAFELPENSIDVDYVQLGLLSDMINI